MLMGGSRVRIKAEGEKRAKFMYSPLTAEEVIAVMAENYSRQPNTLVELKGNKLVVSGGRNFIATARNV